MAYDQIVADSSVPKITFNGPILSIKGKRLLEGNVSASAKITVAGTLAGSDGETFVFNSARTESIGIRLLSCGS